MGYVHVESKVISALSDSASETKAQLESLRVAEKSIQGEAKEIDMELEKKDPL